MLCAACRSKHSWNGILQAEGAWAWAWSDTANHFYVLNCVKYLVSAHQPVQVLRGLQWERVRRRDPSHVQFPAVHWTHSSHRGAHLPKAANTEVFKGVRAASACLRNQSPHQSLWLLAHSLRLLVWYDCASQIIGRPLHKPLTWMNLWPIKSK